MRASFRSPAPSIAIKSRSSGLSPIEEKCWRSPSPGKPMAIRSREPLRWENSARDECPPNAPSRGTVEQQGCGTFRGRPDCQRLDKRLRSDEGGIPCGSRRCRIRVEAAEDPDEGAEGRF